MSEVLTFNAALFGAAWLSVLQGASTDPKDWPFYRSVAVDFYDRGIRLTASDHTVLLTAWIPVLGEEEERPLPLLTVPRQTTVALDFAQRAAALSKYAYKLAIDPDRHEPLPIHVSIEDAEAETMGQLPFDDFEGELLVIDLPGMERLRLRVYGGRFPEWRSILSNFSRKRMTGTTLAPDVLKRLGTLGDWNPGDITLESGGLNAAIRVTIGHDPLLIEGIVMPVRWEPIIQEATVVEVEDAMDTALRDAVDEVFGDPPPEGPDEPAD